MTRSERVQSSAWGPLHAISTLLMPRYGHSCMLHCVLLKAAVVDSCMSHCVVLLKAAVVDSCMSPCLVLLRAAVVDSCMLHCVVLLQAPVADSCRRPSLPPVVCETTGLIKQLAVLTLGVLCGGQYSDWSSLI